MKESHRRHLGTIGIALLVGGIIAILEPIGGTASGLPWLVAIAGGIFGLLMMFLVYRDWITDETVASPPVERAIELPVPGSAFDRTLAQFDGSGRGSLRDQNTMHTRLLDLAVAVLSRRGDYTREEAREAVEMGDWPTDSTIATFLKDSKIDFEQSWRDRLGSIFGEDGPANYQQLVRRTVDRLAVSSEMFDLEAANVESEIDLNPVGAVEHRRRTIPRMESTGGRLQRRYRWVSDPLPTSRWNAVVPVALAFIGFGIALQQSLLIFGGGVAVFFGVFATFFSAPTMPLRIERSLDPIDTERPTPGDEIEVTVTVHNEGEGIQPDIRIIDGVPSGISVEDGSPRLGTSLAPGESTTFSYTITARRGLHEFGPAFTITRDLAHSTVRTNRIEIEEDTDTSFSCVPSLRGLSVSLPLYTQPGEYFGRIPAGGGEGVEFHSTREYRPGDSTTRIDWNRLARSANDELTTVQFREERAATVVLVIDANPDAYLLPEPDHPGALEKSIEAAGQLVGSLLGAGDRVGVAALGPDPAWLDPGVGVQQELRIERFLATDPAFPPTPPTESNHPWWPREFHRRFPNEAQVVLLTPLCDDRLRILINNLHSYGHPVTVISPDPTVDGTVGERLVQLERRIRIETLREAGIHIVDWDMDEELAIVLSRAAERWSR